MSEDTNKIAHLEMIQNIVSRMSQNSLTLKELSVGIISAIFALAASKDVFSCELAMVAFLPAITFWWLDAYFLCQEKRFRRLFDVVRMQEEASIDFCMDTSSQCDEVASHARVMFSKTIAIFHGAIFIAIDVFVAISIWGANGK